MTASQMGKKGGKARGAKKARDPRHYTEILPKARLEAKLRRERGDKRRSKA